MFELPEYTVIAQQINETLVGKVIGSAQRGNTPHKFVWYNVSADEFAEVLPGKTVGTAHSRGKWLFIHIHPGYMLVFGENGGTILYHASPETVPAKHHLLIRFTDGSALSTKTQMWGAMELYKAGREQQRQYIADMRPTPVEPAFTYEHFSGLLELCAEMKMKTTKALLTQNQLIPGLGNAIAQDILFYAGLGPRFPLAELSDQQKHDLYNVEITTVKQVIAQHGRYDEYDLFGNKGGYRRIMDKNSVGRPCRRCGGTIKKIQYLGGACYFCTGCQM